MKKKTQDLARGIREEWLHRIADEFLVPLIAHVGEFPRHRISVGFPKGSRGGQGHSIGQCWARELSADKSFEVFVSPELEAFDAVHVLLHELCHVHVGLEAGHTGPFKKVAARVGLIGKMKATLPGPQLAASIKGWLATGKPYPHAVLRVGAGVKKRPGSRLIKVACSGCGYTVRTSRQWLDVGIVLCPNSACDEFETEMAEEG